MKLLDSGRPLHVRGITTNAAILFWEYLLDNKNKHQSINVHTKWHSFIPFNVVWWNIAYFKDEIDSMYSEQPLHINMSSPTYFSLQNKNRYQIIGVHIKWNCLILNIACFMDETLSTYSGWPLCTSGKLNSLAYPHYFKNAY